MNALLLRLLFYLFVFFVNNVLFDILYGLRCCLVGMKYDLRRLQEIHYDVRIRGLSAKEQSRYHDVWIIANAHSRGMLVS